ncbi:hypothetical protein [Spiroplasma endosymbiont of Nebria brevicollis]|uniref:hypothetical protein n=1 Tax=Spiroplasma endosymbiont of Nebria brevicollis TaxID=3066284 RepID=UPI00313B5094
MTNIEILQAFAKAKDETRNNNELKNNLDTTINNEKKLDSEVTSEDQLIEHSIVNKQNDSEWLKQKNEEKVIDLEKLKKEIEIVLMKKKYLERKHYEYIPILKQTKLLIINAKKGMSNKLYNLFFFKFINY